MTQPAPRTWWQKIRLPLALALAAATLVGWLAWYQLFREVDQQFADEEARFKYGSLGAEADRGIPYAIWLVLPRVFPDKLPGPGGYASFGFVWEPGQEMPVGFSKKTVGFPRVTNNCAFCHAASYRTKPDEQPRVYAAGPAHTANVQGYIRFLSDVGNDPRFNANTLLDEIGRAQHLSFSSRLLYRVALIPLTRDALRRQARQFAWMNRPRWPDWGAGRDDPMNLTKYFMTSLPVDGSTGQADFPSIWNMKIREGSPLNWDGVTPAVRSVLIDSALGLGAPPGQRFLKQMSDLERYLQNVPPPAFPFAIDARQSSRGRALYFNRCAECHEPGWKRTGTVIDISEIGSDRERLDTWTRAAADEANRRVRELGIVRPEMTKTNGYASPPLDGIWLRGPYLHNGSVPTLRDLLKPGKERPSEFYRGYDVLDPRNLGFISDGDEARRVGYRFDVRERGNGNQGHEYGTNLSESDRNDLLEFLKTL